MSANARTKRARRAVLVVRGGAVHHSTRRPLSLARRRLSWRVRASYRAQRAHVGGWHGLAR
eukprot:141434-Pleurochrysis_carterae.AAC.1